VSASGHAIPILVIDDDPTSLDLAVEILALDGYAVRTATTADRGLELTALERPAVILMDLHFAIGMSGLDATRRLKADPLTAGIPVVALTALAQRQAEQKARDAGFAAYLTKPLDVTMLRETVRRFVTGAPG
jgi:two-component system cell cycle response regulator DivK